MESDRPIVRLRISRTVIALVVVILTGLLSDGHGALTEINRGGSQISSGFGALYVKCPRGYYPTRIGRCQKIYAVPQIWK